MKRLLPICVVFSCLLLAACPKPKYDQTISCPTYNQTGVSVYIWETGTFVVAFPPITLENGKKAPQKVDIVSNVQCVVNYK